LNIWSENNWSDFAKQFNKTVDFPFPGQVGVVFEFKKKDIRLGSDSDINKNLKIDHKIAAENINYLLIKPLPQDHQIMKLKEAISGIYLKELSDNGLSSNNALNNLNKGFELKAFKCPKTLQSGKINFILKNEN
jgi:hypothetical protein